MNGFLLVDKPVGISSFQIVSRLRKITGVKRIGFSGTLDPFASGLVVVGIGRLFTRQLDLFTDLHKTYVATMKLGQSTDTLDCKGIITNTRPLSRPWEDICLAIEAVIPEFIGPITQQIPAFSAKKISGERMYRLARRGDDVALLFKHVEIDTLDAVGPHEAPFFNYCVTCSKGTYVRQISVDLAARIQELAYTDQLRRTAIGPLRVEDALPVEQFSIDMIQPRLFTHTAMTEATS